MPLSLHSDWRALNHIEHMHRSRHGRQLVLRLHDLQHSRMGWCATRFCALVPCILKVSYLGAPPCCYRPVMIRTSIRSVRSKSVIPECTLRQETAATLKDMLTGCLRVFTDGSVLVDGSAATACVVPSSEVHIQCRVVCEAFSKVAELAALNVAGDALLQLQVRFSRGTIGLQSCAPAACEGGQNAYPHQGHCTSTRCPAGPGL